jgi:hypothetical protein
LIAAFNGPQTSSMSSPKSLEASKSALAQRMHAAGVG